MKTREPDQKPEESDDGAGLEACAQELIRAVHARDVKAVAQALQDAFELADSEPHEEGPHIEPHSYEASKQD